MGGLLGGGGSSGGGGIGGSTGDFGSGISNFFGGNMFGGPSGGGGGGMDFSSMFDPTSWMGAFGDPLSAAQTAMTGPSASQSIDPNTGTAQAPGGGQQSGGDTSPLRQLSNMVMGTGGGFGSGVGNIQRTPPAPAPGQQTAPSWFQNPMTPDRWQQGDPSRSGAPTVMSGGSPYQPAQPQPRRVPPRPAPAPVAVPLPRPRPAGADYDPSTDPNPAAGYGGAEDPNYYGGSASPAAGPAEAASAGLDLSQGGPGIPTPEMANQPNFSPYNPVTDPFGAGQTVGDPTAQAQPGVNIPGVTIRRENPPETSADVSLTGAGPAPGVPLPRPRPPGADAPSMLGDLSGLTMQAGDGTNIQTDSSDPRVQQAVSNITGAQAPNAPGGSNLPGGHVPTTAGGTTGAAQPQAPGGAGLPGGHVPSSAAAEQPQPGDTTTPAAAQPTVGGGYDPGTGQPYPTNQGGYGQQGGMGQMNPMRMLFDMLFGGPQALMQDLSSLAGQAGGMQGAQANAAPWLSQPGGRAPRGTNPYNYPMATPEQIQQYRQTGVMPPAQGQPGTQSGATVSPQSSQISGEKDGFVPRENQGLTNEVAANTPVSGAVDSGTGFPRGANYMRAMPPGGLSNINVGGKTAQVNRQAAPYFQNFLNGLRQAGAPIQTVDGYNPRNIRGSNRPSQHAFGNAVDVNENNTGAMERWLRNPQNMTTFRNLQRQNNIYWGGDWGGRTRDPMHIEWAGPRAGPQGAQAPPAAAAQAPAAAGNQGHWGRLADAISKVEGFGRPGTIATDYNNPGNLRFGALARKYGAVQGPRGGGYARFPSAEAGRRAQIELLQNKYAGQSLAQIGRQYAPVGDPSGPDNARWAANVARIMGVNPNAVMAMQ